MLAEFLVRISLSLLPEGERVVLSRLIAERPTFGATCGEAFASIRSVSRTFSAALSIILLLRFRQLPLPRTKTVRAGALGGAFLVK